VNDMRHVELHVASLPGEVESRSRPAAQISTSTTDLCLGRRCDLLVCWRRLRYTPLDLMQSMADNPVG